MKKILLLGGSRYILPVINKIHELGHYAITCDYLPDNIAHKYSDEYYNVSIIEKEKVLELAQKLKIDGILSFACDPGVETAYYVAEKMGLPGHPYESVKILQNKSLFRKFLKENNFNVPKAKGYSDIQEAIQEANKFKWPIIVKPVDSAGSKGVTKVEKLSELKNAVEYAKTFSKSQSFIIEEFIEKKGNSSDSDCFSINGNLVFASFSCQYFDSDADNPYTPAAYTWPSNMPLEIQKDLRKDLQRLFELLNLNTSIYNIETRQGVDGKPYIMEVSPRGGGNRLSEMLKYASGNDLIEAAIKAAIGENVTNLKSDPEYKGYWTEIILHSKNSGKLKKIIIDDTIEKYLIEEDVWVKQGELIKSFTGANEAIGTLVFNFPNEELMNEIINDIYKYVNVIVE